MVVDTETTGLLDYPKVEVIEIAIVSMKGKVLYHSRFRSRHRIPKQVIKIHGITNSMVKMSPGFNEEYARIKQILDGKVAVAYKSEFDEGVISKTCQMYSLPVPDCRWECAMRAYRSFRESKKYLPLPNAVHNAISDCQSIRELLKQMATGCLKGIAT
ncbi:MAG: 3'-5' exonuclease [Phycisphaeraceae bacterium]|nr:3'-5' exonuclease [Phycisphaeraceae bacterium]